MLRAAGFRTVPLVRVARVPADRYIDIPPMLLLEAEA
jgi:hypothetical protein